MKSKSTSKTTPVYGQQIEGAAGNISTAYGAQAPKQTAITDTIGGYAPMLADRLTNGDPGINAATSYNTGLLNKDWDGGGPVLQGIIDQTLNDTRNQTTAALGVRGLTGGSTAADIVSRNTAAAANNLRYADLNNYRSRQEAAAGRAGSLAAAGYLPLQGLIDSATAQGIPIQTAVGAGSGIGGLLGSYTNNQQTQTGSIGQLIGMLGGSALSGWAGGGFKGI